MFRENRKLKSIFFIGFLFSLHLALTTYINSSFLTSFVDEKWVGLIYIVASIISIITLLLAPKIFSSIGGYKFLLYTTFFSAFALLTFTFAENIYLAIPAFILYFASNILIIFSLDEVVKIFSYDSGVGKIRGIYLGVSSLAWVIAQVASSRILSKFSFEIAYLLTFFIIASFFIVSLFVLKGMPEPKYDKSNPLKSIREFFKNKNLFRAYRINFLLQFFYTSMIIYTPIYLSIHLGFDWREIGMIFAIMLLPFLFLPSSLGKYSDKIGERKMLMFGFSIASIFTFSLFFLGKNEIWVWALLLFMTRIGAATIETMSDVYFFKHIKPENEEFIGVYRSATPVSYIVGPLIASAVFSIFPTFNFIFIVLGVVMSLGIYTAHTIRRNDI